uniref:Uncharacterized protein n=1 Tax=Timspurckia oligopyrenoides TaxID=708627 RepID=A0A7S0ZHC5_9RHOD|mmetsp:Transcript_5266/g.9203  ORF Transcript_5266/g.9203 Transcript_5266/m.9203 type:complete len:801 (+) Transcript_5266:47-2449(+)
MLRNSPLRSSKERSPSYSRDTAAESKLELEQLMSKDFVPRRKECTASIIPQILVAFVTACICYLWITHLLDSSLESKTQVEWNIEGITGFYDKSMDGSDSELGVIAIKSILSDQELIPNESKVSNASLSVALITSCGDEHSSSLQAALSTWTEVEFVNQIIVVDWPQLLQDSDVSLIQTHRDGVQVVRIQDGDENSLENGHWMKDVLRRRALGYTLASTFAVHDWILKVPCNCALSPSILRGIVNRIRAGESMHSLDIRCGGGFSERVMFILKSQFWKANAYDERPGLDTTMFSDSVTPYLLDEMFSVVEDNFIDELQRQMPKESQSYSFDQTGVLNLPVLSSHTERSASGIELTRILLKGFMSAMRSLEPWDGSHSAQYCVTNRVPKNTQQMLVLSPCSNISEKFETGENATVSHFSVNHDRMWSAEWMHSRIIREAFKLPRDLLASMDAQQLNTLKDKLVQRKVENHVDQTPRILLVQVMHGLGNRLRTLASALSYARNTNRTLIVLWQIDSHVTAAFEDLFDAEQSDFIVISQMKASWEDLNQLKNGERVKGLDSITWINNFDFYNYMDGEVGSVKSESIRSDPQKHVFLRSSSILEADDSRLCSWDSSNEELRKLSPSLPVMEQFSVIRNGLQSVPFQSIHPVHIRCRSLKQDILDPTISVEHEYSAESASEMDLWRMKASPKTFESKIHQILSTESPQSVFLIAADDNAAVEYLRSSVGTQHVINIGALKDSSFSINCDGNRESICVQRAFAEALVLAYYAQSNQYPLLGSNWSSFTELIQRLGASQAHLAGVHF